MCDVDSLIGSSIYIVQSNNPPAFKLGFVVDTLSLSDLVGALKLTIAGFGDYKNTSEPSLRT